MNKEPIVNEVFSDNGEHSHWNLIDPETGENLWSEDPEEDEATGHPVKVPDYLVKCECGCSVPEKFTVYDAGGGHVCMPCHLELLKDDDYAGRTPAGEVTDGRLLIIDGINNDTQEVESFKDFKAYAEEFIEDGLIHPDIELIELFQRVGYVKVGGETGQFTTNEDGEQIPICKVEYVNSLSTRDKFAIKKEPACICIGEFGEDAECLACYPVSPF